jgi:DNA-binding NarL/FixJ family response regulator
MKITLGVVDHHSMFMNSLSKLIGSFPAFVVAATATTAQAMQANLEALDFAPDIVLVDANLDGMKGVELVRHIARLWAGTRVVALVMYDDDPAIIGMLRAGCCGYLMKGAGLAELERDLLEIYDRRFFNGDHSNLFYRRQRPDSQPELPILLDENEIRFLRLASSDLSDLQLSSEFNLSGQVFEHLRKSLFEKLRVQSRTGLVLEAIRLDYVHF